MWGMWGGLVGWQMKEPNIKNMSSLAKVSVDRLNYDNYNIIKYILSNAELTAYFAQFKAGLVTFTVCGHPHAHNVITCRSQ